MCLIQYNMVNQEEENENEEERNETMNMKRETRNRERRAEEVGKRRSTEAHCVHSSVIMKLIMIQQEKEGGWGGEHTLGAAAAEVGHTRASAQTDGRCVTDRLEACRLNSRVSRATPQLDAMAEGDEVFHSAKLRTFGGLTEGSRESLASRVAKTQPGALADVPFN